ncbi:hypothetical protein [Lachnotalea glycerini]|uniref:Uncharacterized protein n=1 Tax=Lachnotalea glycerini TaxID=1763509 RepID=A0A371JBK3_9FIRM|nr:hypothetical protein [Lachnotalea glycerini]RDY30142.1 hypothetical protein CG710_016300 [Lachnotalea glycerini]
MSKTGNNEVMKNMEFLVKELHKEWDRSGEIKTTVMIGVEEAPEVNETLRAKIASKQVELESTNAGFKEAMKMARENYVLIRVVRKIKTQEEKTNKKGMDLDFSVAFDKDEIKLFKELFDAKLK